MRTWWIAVAVAAVVGVAIWASKSQREQTASTPSTIERTGPIPDRPASADSLIKQIQQTANDSSKQLNESAQQAKQSMSETAKQAEQTIAETAKQAEQELKQFGDAMKEKAETAQTEAATTATETTQQLGLTAPQQP